MNHGAERAINRMLLLVYKLGVARPVIGEPDKYWRFTSSKTAAFIGRMNNLYRKKWQWDK